MSKTTDFMILTHNQRHHVPYATFGMEFLTLEATVFNLADQLSENYTGGCWDFLVAPNGAFYMRPDDDTQYLTRSPNGSQYLLNADTFGLVVCLFTYSMLSFKDNQLATKTAKHYHLLREAMFNLDHPHIKEILALID